ncbi:MAG: hypothetical protein PHS59_07825 [Paludibacter sp.]|nr:hypothetical protein [Paludibacter sp.]
MTQFVHKFSISIYFIIIIVTIVVLAYFGFSFYNLPEEERFFHPLYESLKPSGFFGHGLGIIGTSILLFGLFSYMARKRMKIFSRWGVLKYWLEFHIFMCTLGAVLILFHTSFKFGGIISIGFWSLAIVWVSGVIGRFLYIQIPRTIEGRELSLHEAEEIKNQIADELLEKYQINFHEIMTSKFSEIKAKLISENVHKHDFRKVKKQIRKERILAERIKRLDQMLRLFKYWHVAHLPFALVMLLIMVIHVIVVLTLGYQWVF